MLVNCIIGSRFDAALRNTAVVLNSVVLRPDLEEIIQQCCERGGNTLDPAPICLLDRQMKALGAPEGHALSVAGLGVGEACRAIGKALESGRPMAS